MAAMATNRRPAGAMPMSTSAVRSNQTHLSTSDPDAMLYRKGPGMEARLCFIGHALMENRHGLFVDTRLTRVSGHAERLAALRATQPTGSRMLRVSKYRRGP